MLKMLKFSKLVVYGTVFQRIPGPLVYKRSRDTPILENEIQFKTSAAARHNNLIFSAVLLK